MRQLLRSVSMLVGISVAGAYSCWTPRLSAAEDVEVASDAVAAPEEFDDDIQPLVAPKLPAPEGAKPLPEPDRVWVDAQRRRVYVDGYVSLREGYLEMFACTEGTKEHESIVAVRSRAYVVHAALLSVGAQPGRPAQFRPEYQPPTGAEIDVEVRWVDEQGQWQKARAQDWVLQADNNKPMKQPWVFAGSGFYVDEETGKRYYMAEQGDLICVSNFISATLDIPMESSSMNDGLLFKANTSKIPPLGLPVRLVLTPKLKKGAKAERREASSVETRTSADDDAPGEDD